MYSAALRSSHIKFCIGVILYHALQSISEYSKFHNICFFILNRKGGKTQTIYTNVRLAHTNVRLEEQLRANNCSQATADVILTNSIILIIHKTYSNLIYFDGVITSNKLTNGLIKVLKGRISHTHLEKNKEEQIYKMNRQLYKNYHCI